MNSLPVNRPYRRSGGVRDGFVFAAVLVSIRRPEKHLPITGAALELAVERGTRLY